MSEQKLTFLLAVHNHQPVGNFPSVFEKAFGDCYRPFFEQVEKHPALKVTVHFSGPLWEYMQVKDTASWDLMHELVRRGQVELLGGGFYEPILSVIPEGDRLGQLAMMSQFLEKEFGTRPRGAWLAERVWEPFLPKTLSRAGIEYTLLDEEHFHYAGISDIHKPYLTEDEGSALKIFPIDKKLRYLVPFREMGEIRAYLDSIKRVEGLAILGDDGEKFGLWPGTKARVYGQGWLARFLEFLESEDIQTLTYSEALDSHPPKGRVYLPPASYEEMMEWVLEPEDFEIFQRVKAQTSLDARRFIRGGFFRDFFVKYPESNHLHKKMLFVSGRVREAGDAEARKEVYKGQGNDPYWHGIFGGLYLPHLREDAYAHLLRAERRLPGLPSWRELDFDLDGTDEILRQIGSFGLILKPSCGGSIIELDYYPLSRNLADVLSRRGESYHIRKPPGTTVGKSIHEMAKELPPRAERLLRLDDYRRASCLDHFFHPATTREQFENREGRELGDFIGRPYDFRIETAGVSLSRTSSVWIDGKQGDLSVRKTVVPRADQILVRYTIQNRSDKVLDLLFGCEWNLYQIPEEWRLEDAAVSLCLGKLIFEAEPRPAFWHYPLQTLSQSEEGYDIIHQGICLLPKWKISLSGGSVFSAEIRLRETKK